MAKRETVIVDEDYLKDMMAGDVPRIRRENKEKTENEKEVVSADSNSVPDSTSIKTKQTGDIVDYTTLFLKNNTLVNRKATYISADVLDKISRYLPILNRNLSIAGHIDNILLHHLEQYKDEINALYEFKSQKPL